MLSDAYRINGMGTGNSSMEYRSVKKVVIRRGDIYYADLSPVVGSEQGGIRPVLVIQNNVGNRHSPTVICAAITSRMNKAKLPTHIEISAKNYKIVKNSVILLEQIYRGYRIMNREPYHK